MGKYDKNKYNNQNSIKNNIKFLVKFFIYCIVLFLILEPLGVKLINLVAYQSYLILNLFTDASYNGCYIYLNNLKIEVIGVCTGLWLISIYLALVLALSRNIKEVVIGLPLLALVYFGNILRIVLVGALGMLFVNKVHTIHDIVGYTTVPIMTVMASMIYMKILDKMRENNGNSNS
ncbi:archaeosortase family protein ArtE [Methanothermococcus sp.]|uniref:archaeosortase family protein ArtE n=1 Tax=Methanothermococcus sp. TaxID=2614238 RepID=UPI0025F658B3|nr:archaeosortase family protein ArtE [Methanothermococcus sp.]